jgi:hypothetical protein
MKEVLQFIFLFVMAGVGIWMVYQMWREIARLKLVPAEVVNKLPERENTVTVILARHWAKISVDEQAHLIELAVELGCQDQEVLRQLLTEKEAQNGISWEAISRDVQGRARARLRRFLNDQNHARVMKLDEARSGR